MLGILNHNWRFSHLRPLLGDLDLGGHRSSYLYSTDDTIKGIRSDCHYFLSHNSKTAKTKLNVINILSSLSHPFDFLL